MTIELELDANGECGCDYAPDGWECAYHADITQNGPLDQEMAA